MTYSQVGCGLSYGNREERAGLDLLFEGNTGGDWSGEEKWRESRPMTPRLGHLLSQPPTPITHGTA